MCVFIVFIIYQRKQNLIIWKHYCPYLHSVLFSFMTSLTFLWRIIRNSEGRITLIDDLENDQFYTKSASIVICK